MQTIAINELGRRIGESHPNAKLTNHEAELLVELVEGGMSLAQAAAKFEVSKSCAAHIVSGRRRGQVVARTVSVTPKNKR